MTCGNANTLCSTATKKGLCFSARETTRELFLTEVGSRDRPVDNPNPGLPDRPSGGALNGPLTRRSRRSDRIRLAAIAAALRDMLRGELRDPQELTAGIELQPAPRAPHVIDAGSQPGQLDRTYSHWSEHPRDNRLKALNEDQRAGARHGLQASGDAQRDEVTDRHDQGMGPGAGPVGWGEQSAEHRLLAA
jgi:hypothetical protein